MRNTLGWCFCLSVLTVPGCEQSDKARVVGSGTLIGKTPVLAVFDEVQLVGGFRVDVSLGDKPSLVITTDDNIMPFIESSVQGSTLVVRRRDDLEPSDGVALKIVTADLSRFAVEGALMGEIKNITGDAFAVVVKGAGKITVTGKVADLVLEVHGAASIDALDLEASAVDVTLNGAGRIQTHAIRMLNVTLAGLGVVEYRGDPQVTKSASALARIIKLE